MTEQEIKYALNHRVRFKSPHNHVDAPYILSGATIRMGDKGFYYQAELTDIRNPKSLVICRLDEIEREARSCGV